MKTYHFKVKINLSIDVQAESEEQARTLARQRYTRETGKDLPDKELKLVKGKTK